MWKAVQTVFQSQRSRLPACVENSLGKNIQSCNLILARPSPIQQTQISAFSVSAGTGSCSSSLGAIGYSSSGSPSSFLRPWSRSSESQSGRDQESSIGSCSLNQVTTYVPSRGLKIKGKVKRRCKDCQLIWEEGVLWNRCETHPRHKQMLKQQYWPNLRILTHATNGPTAPWKWPANGWNRRSSI